MKYHVLRASYTKFSFLSYNNSAYLKDFNIPLTVTREWEISYILIFLKESKVIASLYNCRREGFKLYSKHCRKKKLDSCQNILKKKRKKKEKRKKTNPEEDDFLFIISRTS